MRAASSTLRDRAAGALFEDKFSRFKVAMFEPQLEHCPLPATSAFRAAAGRALRVLLWSLNVANFEHSCFKRLRSTQTKDTTETRQLSMWVALSAGLCPASASFAQQEKRTWLATLALKKLRLSGRSLFATSPRARHKSLQRGAFQ